MDLIPKTYLSQRRKQKFSTNILHLAAKTELQRRFGIWDETKLKYCMHDWQDVGDLPFVRAFLTGQMILKEVIWRMSSTEAILDPDVAWE